MSYAKPYIDVALCVSLMGHASNPKGVAYSLWEMLCNDQLTPTEKKTLAAYILGKLEDMLGGITPSHTPPLVGLKVSACPICGEEGTLEEKPNDYIRMQLTLSCCNIKVSYHEAAELLKGEME